MTRKGMGVKGSKVHSPWAGGSKVWLLEGRTENKRHAWEG